MTFTKGPTISFTYEEVKDLVLQLEDADKLRLAKEMKKAGVPYDWDTIFAAFKPNQVTQRAIDREVKAVRAKRQARRRGEAASGRH